MPVAVIAVNPGGTAEMDEAIQKHMSLDDNPAAGSVVRIAGPYQDGWRIISVWDSRDAFDAFRRDRLEPALRQAGRPVPEFEFWPVHSVRINPQKR